MAQRFLWILVAVFALRAGAAERVFDFGGVPEGQTPSGFRSLVAGEGKPGDWRVTRDSVPALMPAFSTNAAVVPRAVLAQVARDRTDEHYPMLVFDGEVYADFTVTTRFKIVDGAAEQMAGLAFRVQDARNFYVVRASALGRNVRFYKMVNGERSAPIGPDVDVSKGVWHELTIECKGNQIRCRFNGREAFPTLTDNSFARGKIAFWTKSDSVSYFTDTKITYVPLERPAQAIVRDLMKRNSRLVGIEVFATPADSSKLSLVAASDPTKVGRPGSTNEQDVLDHGTLYYGKEKGTVSVMMPLRDRNGDVIAAVRITMESFTGQTQQNAIVRATPIVKEMQERVLNVKDLFE